MRQTTIHQPAPCAESWDAMAPTDAGRHCAACQTQVVDFTHMTDGEVVAFPGQYHPVRRCGRFREDQVDRPLLPAARAVTGCRRWAGAAVLLLGSVVGLKARAQGEKPGYNARHLAPATTSITHADIPDSMFLVQGVVRNRWGIRKAGVRVRLRRFEDSTDARGHFRLLIPKRELGVTPHIVATYWKPSYGRNHLGARVLFDSTRTKPYHIKMRKIINRNPGFFQAYLIFLFRSYALASRSHSQALPRKLEGHDTHRSRPLLRPLPNRSHRLHAPERDRNTGLSGRAAGATRVRCYAGAAGAAAPQAA